MNGFNECKFFTFLLLRMSSPESGSKNDEIISISVDFPLPDGPTKAICSFLMLIFILDNVSVFLNEKEMFFNDKDEKVVILLTFCK